MFYHHSIHACLKIYSMPHLILLICLFINLQTLIISFLEKNKNIHVSNKIYYFLNKKFYWQYFKLRLYNRCNFRNLITSLKANWIWRNIYNKDKKKNLRKINIFSSLLHFITIFLYLNYPVFVTLHIAKLIWQLCNSRYKCQWIL